MKTTDFIKENKFIGDDAHAMHQDHEVQMARSDCYNAAKYAIELHKLLKNISEMQGLDGWVSEKITLANDYLRTVAEYLRHEAVMDDQGLPEMFTAESAEARFDQLLSEESTVAEESENLTIGEKMARDGIEYDPAREGEIISMIGDYLRRDGMTTRQVRGYMIDPDFISDQLSYLPRKSGVAEARPDVMRHTGDKTVRVVKKGGKPIGEIGLDTGYGEESYYVKLYDGSYDAAGFDTAEEALEELKYAVKQMSEGVTEAAPKITGQTDYTGQDLVKDANKLFTAGGFKLADKQVEPRQDDPKKINTIYFWRKKIPGLGVQELMIEVYNYAPHRTYYAVNDYSKDGAKVTPELAQKMWREMEFQIKDMSSQFGLSETTSAGGVATVPGVGGGPKVGSLFGGSYSPKTPFTGKKKAKESIIKR